MPKALALTHSHEYGALLLASHAYCRALRAIGYMAEIIDLASTEGLQTLEGYLKNGRIEFCFGLQGVGSCLTIGPGTNLWAAYCTPFVGLHYDHPCHNPFNHFNESPYVGYLYAFESFLETKKQYLPSTQICDFFPFRFLEQPPQPQTRFEDRPIRLLYVKAGAALDDLVSYINSLPPIVRDGIWDHLDRAWKSPNLSLCALVEEIFIRAGYDRKMKEPQFWGVVQTMDLYLRRKRAIEFVNWLKFQKGAVIVGGGWDFIDKIGAQAEFKPSLPAHEAFSLYEQTQFTCNANPYGRDVIHERSLYGLMMGGCVLTDANAWWSEHFAGVPALTLYDWAWPLGEQLEPALADINHTAETSRAAREAVLQRIPEKGIQALPAFARNITTYARGI